MHMPAQVGLLITYCIVSCVLVLCKLCLLVLQVSMCYAVVVLVLGVLSTIYCSLLYKQTLFFLFIDLFSD